MSMVTTHLHRLVLAGIVGSALLLSACGESPSTGGSAGLPSNAVIPLSGTSSSGAVSSGRFGYLRDRMTAGSGAVATSTGAVAIASSSSSFSARPVATVTPTASGFVLPPIPALPPIGSVTSSSSRPAIASVPTSGSVDSSVWTSMNEKLAISVTPDRFEVFPGETVTYRIRICNSSSDDLQNIPVSFAFADYEMEVISVSDGGIYAPGTPLVRTAAQRNPLPPVTGSVVNTQPKITVDSMGIRSNQNRVDWLIPFLGAGETKVLTVTLRMDERLHRGDIVRGDAIAAATGMQQIRALSQVRILERMPQAGIDASDPSSSAPMIEESWNTGTETIRPDILFAPIQ